MADDAAQALARLAAAARSAAHASAELASVLRELSDTVNG